MKISIAAGATVILDSVDITGTNDGNYSWAGINCVGDATIILSGDNNVKGFYYDYPGVHIASGYTLTIKGDGSLTPQATATGGQFGADIGSGPNASCGTITITDGVTSVTATNGENASHSIGAGP